MEDNKNENVRIIKRYQNRKLYDTFQSCYVTLPEIALIMKMNNEVKVIDNKTKADITPLTLIQVIAEEERRNLSHEDVSLLEEVIKTEGSFLAYIKKIKENK